MKPIEELLEQLTLQEKASLLAGSDFWNTKAIPRLGIPAVTLADGPHGLRKHKGGSDVGGLNESLPATCFPTASCTAASFDRSLLQEIGAALAKEAIAQGVQVLLGPGVNLKRHPLGGRNFEYFSEDPLLAGELAAAMITGMQNQGVGASLKHFACNNQERARLLNESIVDERSLRELYLKAFEIAVKKAQPWTVMTSYNRLNGSYASESSYLFTEILRKTWGFEGLALTDWGANNNRVAGVAAGVDLEMPYSGPRNERAILAAVENGSLSLAAVDACVRRVLQLVEKADKSTMKPSVDWTVHDQLAARAAAESAVLLKNSGVLPLDPKEKWIVLGQFAEMPRYQGSGSSRVNPINLSSPLDALRASEIDFVYAPGYGLDDSAAQTDTLEQALKLAATGRPLVIFAGQPDSYESEGFDRRGLDLPSSQNALIESAAELNPQTVVVLMSGGVLRLPWLDKVAAVLYMGLGGQAVGTAAVDLLCGKVNPSGKLAETFPFNAEDMPADANFGERWQTQYREGLFIGYRYVDAAGIPVQFPFGFGLSYTNFVYSDLHLDAETLSEGQQLSIRFKLRNAGQAAGKESVQVYISSPQSTVFKAPKTLQDFDKVYLEPGESRELQFTLDPANFAFWNTNTNSWQVEPGEYQLQIAASSQDIRLQATFEVVTESFVQVPDLSQKAPAYYQLSPDWQVPLADFEALYGSEIPEPAIANDDYSMNTTLAEVEHTLIGKLIKRYGLRVIAQMNPGDDEAAQNARAAMHEMIYDMPLRSMTMNGVPGTVVEGILYLLQGKVFKGLGALLKTLFD